jgi:TolB-like protein/DNA-binding winged helix-turn-helix (wHTH) protein/cytochrome c-type biogenesis protein CcmH/NrfG
MAVMEAAESAQLYEIGGFRVDAAQRVLFAADGTRIALSSRAFDLLLYFIRHPGELLDKNRLMAAVWPNTVVEENNLNQSIGALRKALGESAGEHRFLVNEPGRGYRFVAPVRVPGPGAPPVVHRKSRRGPLLAGLALLLAAIVAALAWWHRAPEPVIDRSIAVLPFENRSAAPENEYLARGVQDEVLTLLTRVGDLRVLSRNSTQRYAGSAATARQIGREIGVSYLLEGSVQRAADRVRVIVTLIDTADDRHLWAATYDRAANEVFAVESEVAQGVAQALQARLTDEEHAKITQPPSANPAAYDAYLRARAFAERTTRTEAEIRAAIAAYTEAVRLDPDFAIAWAQLSRRHANFFSLAYDRSAARRDAALDALEHATRLAPDLIDTLAARGYFDFVVEGNLKVAEGEFLALESRAPQSADAAAGLAQITRELGQPDRSADYARRVLALDPLNPYRHSLMCLDYLTSREFDLALNTCKRALELLPGDTGILAITATIHQARGELDEARAMLRTLKPDAGDWRSLRVLSRQSLLDRKPADAVRLLGRYLENADALGTRRGVVRRWLADAQRLAGEDVTSKATYRLALAEIEAEIARQSSNPVLMAELETVRGRLGQFEAALRLEPRCLELASQPRREAFIGECAIARIQAELAAGDPARSVVLLKGALGAQGVLPPLTPALLKLDPEYDALRVRTDFQALTTGTGRP